LPLIQVSKPGLTSSGRAIEMADSRARLCSINKLMNKRSCWCMFFACFSPGFWMLPASDSRRRKGVIMKVTRQKKTVVFCEDHNQSLVQTRSRPGTSAQNPLPQRFWVETAMGLVSAVLLVLTVLIPDWIERQFGSMPDSGDGSTEWKLALSLAAGSVVMFGFAGRMWKKHVRLLRSA
jgi:hypothetical protein